MPETILLTGTSGYIALHILKQLLEEGVYQVRGTVRSTKNEEKIKPIIDLVPNAKYPVQLVEADLLSDKGWAEAVMGCEYVMHTASPFFFSHGKTATEQLVKPAVEGTIRVLEECAKKGSIVKRVVLTSSMMAVSYGNDHDNDYVYTPEDWSNPETVEPYTASKTLAERAAWDFVKNNSAHKFDMTTINPGLVFGETLGSPGTSVNIIKNIINGKVPMAPKLNFEIVDVEDVARAHVRAMVIPEASGKRFVLVAGNMPAIDVAKVITKEFGPMGYNKQPTRLLPYSLGWLLSFFMDDMKSIVEGWGKIHKANNSQTTELLGIQFKSIEQSIIETVHSLIDRNFVAKTSEYKSRT
eukprot:CFRG6525T1